MLIQNSGSATPVPGHAGDSAPVSVAAPPSKPAPAEQPQPAVKPAPTAAQVQSAVDNINRAMRQSNSNVEFSIDKDTKQTVIKVVESQTGDVIRQFPSEEILAISHAIDQMQQRGLLLKQEA
jgi:flagellar protein FlaG